MALFSQWGSFFTRTRGASLTLTAGLMLAGAGCAVESGAGESALSSPAGGEAALEDVDLPVPFASFETDDGGTVQFFEPEPGELLISSVSKIGSRDPLDEMAPAALYEALAGEPLPERFIATLALGDAAAEGEVAEGDAVEAPLAESGATYFSAPSARQVEGVTREDLTPEEFVENHCNFGTTTSLWCWLNRTGTSYFSQRRVNMGADAYVFVGSVTHRLRRKNTWGNWKTLSSAAVPAGYRSHAFNNSGIAYTHESRVDDASGAGYHHSGYHY